MSVESDIVLVKPLPSLKDFEKAGGFGRAVEGQIVSDFAIILMIAILLAFLGGEFSQHYQDLHAGSAETNSPAAATCSPEMIKDYERAMAMVTPKPKEPPSLNQPTKSPPVVVISQGGTVWGATQRLREELKLGSSKIEIAVAVRDPRWCVVTTSKNVGLGVPEELRSVHVGDEAYGMVCGTSGCGQELKALDNLVCGGKGSVKP